MTGARGHVPATRSGCHLFTVPKMAFFDRAARLMLGLPEEPRRPSELGDHRGRGSWRTARSSRAA
jgi:hypothetical protein